jgi:hypothetical protein
METRRFIDKNGEEILCGELVKGPGGGSLRLCQTGDNEFILLDSMMFPFEIEYLSECVRIKKPSQ